MAKDIITKAEILGGEIDVRANFGQTVKVTVSPDPYMGDTEVTPSDQTQVLQTKKKFVQDDITVYPAPVETLSTTENGQFTPSSGKVGFSAVTVDVNPDLRPLSVSENGQYSPDGFDGYSQVSVDVPQKYDINAIADGSISGEIVLDTAPNVAQFAFYGCTNITKVTALLASTVGWQAFRGSGVESAYFPSAKTINSEAFHTSKYSGNIGDDFPVVETIDTGAFRGTRISVVHLPSTLKSLTGTAPLGFNRLRIVYFHSTPTSITGSCFSGNNITDIYVPWSEGDVANAPWGANNATIHYDTVYDKDGNVVSST